MTTKKKNEGQQKYSIKNRIINTVHKTKQMKNLMKLVRNIKKNYCGINITSTTNDKREE